MLKVMRSVSVIRVHLVVTDLVEYKVRKAKRESWLYRQNAAVRRVLKETLVTRVVVGYQDKKDGRVLEDLLDQPAFRG